jgi:hypothetical protein
VELLELLELLEELLDELVELLDELLELLDELVEPLELSPEELLVTVPPPQATSVNAANAIMAEQLRFFIIDTILVITPPIFIR